MEPVVALETCASYEDRELDRALATVLAEACDWAGLCRNRSTVLLKPNLVAARAPDSAVTTHPAFIAAVVRAVRRHHGGRLRLGDSPIASTVTRVAAKLDLPRLLRDHDVEIVHFVETVKIPGGGGFGPFDVARAVVEADLVINLPKVKTHAQMALTLGVKNLFGAFVGLEKVRWHLHAGRDEATFARLLLELARRVAPALTIADGVVGMQGNGPTAGRPRHLGLIAASTDALALDRAIAEILGFAVHQVPVLQQAALQKHVAVDAARIETRGQPLDRFRVARWEPARPGACNATLIPSLLAHLLRHQLTTRPVFNHRRCTRCGQCIQHCGPVALSLARRGRADPGPVNSDWKIAPDLDRCIRCYCCQEVCPQGAVSVGEGAVLGLCRRIAAARR